VGADQARDSRWRGRVLLAGISNRQHVSAETLAAADLHLATETIGVRRLGQRRVDPEVFARTYPNARLSEPGAAAW
jgi:hypothetical protein